MGESRHSVCGALVSTRGVHLFRPLPDSSGGSSCPSPSPLPTNRPGTLMRLLHAQADGHHTLMVPGEQLAALLRMPLSSSRSAMSPAQRNQLASKEEGKKKKKRKKKKMPRAAKKGGYGTNGVAIAIEGSNQSPNRALTLCFESFRACASRRPSVGRVEPGQDHCGAQDGAAVSRVQSHRLQSSRAQGS